MNPYHWRADAGYWPHVNLTPPPGLVFYGGAPHYFVATPPPPPPPVPAAAPGTPGHYDGGHRHGVTYLFPPKLISLHVLSDVGILSGEYHGRPAMRIYNIEEAATIKDLIARLGGNEKTVLTEVFEDGAGRWGRGSSFAQKEAASDQMLREVGWTARRGRSLEPVWVVMHSV